MESLYSQSEVSLAKRLIAGKPLNRVVITFAAATTEVQYSHQIPPALRSQLIRRVLNILRQLENKHNLLDMCFASRLPHSGCSEQRLVLGELWDLPREQEWLCEQCGRPLYVIDCGSGTR